MTLSTYSVVQFQTGEVRHISHLNFTAWPDHDTPSQPDDLLTFISYMRHVHRSGPIITHCSAGIGRSGTLICIDVVLGLISQDLEVSTGCVVISEFFIYQFVCTTQNCILVNFQKRIGHNQEENNILNLYLFYWGFLTIHLKPLMWHCIFTLCSLQTCVRYSLLSHFQRQKY